MYMYLKYMSPDGKVNKGFERYPQSCLTSIRAEHTSTEVGFPTFFVFSDFPC
jgi:hypothetical protein